MLVIEHDMPLAMGISDRVYCLEAGRVIAEGRPNEIVQRRQSHRELSGPRGRSCCPTSRQNNKHRRLCRHHETFQSNRIRVAECRACGDWGLWSQLGTAAAASSTSPGVTGNTITIGVTYVDLASVAQFIHGLNQGNYQAVYQALDQQHQCSRGD